LLKTRKKATEKQRHEKTHKTEQKINKFQHRQKNINKRTFRENKKEKIPQQNIVFKWKIAGVQGTRLAMPGAMGIVHGDVVLSVGIPLAKWDERTARADVGKQVSATDAVEETGPTREAPTAQPAHARQGPRHRLCRKRPINIVQLPTPRNCNRICMMNPKHT
jgi:hypothetical protein